MNETKQCAQRRVSDERLLVLLEHITDDRNTRDLSLDLFDERAAHAETQRERDALKAALAETNDNLARVSRLLSESNEVSLRRLAALAALVEAGDAADYEFVCLEPRLTEPFRSAVAEAKSVLRTALTAAREVSK